jgi:uncharacterized protein YbjT (DUF2867 family)
MKILVAGATGNVGRHLVEQLNASGHRVRALTRNAAKAQFSQGVEVIEGDLARPETIKAALAGVEALHLITFGGDNYEPLQTPREIVALAEQAGVKRVTVLCGGQKGAVEEAVEASTMAWTLLQPVEFMINILEWAEPIRTEGQIKMPFSNRKTAIVHEADIAAVAAAVLTQDGHGGKTYPITGPEVLTPREMVRIIGQRLGREIKLIELSEAEAVAEWKAAGMPEEVIQFMLWVYGNTPPIGYTVVNTVEEVTGCPPRRFAEWAKEFADHFRAPVTQA